MTELYLIRHGITAANLEHRMQGKTDQPLCGQGLAQLPYLQAHFQSIRVDAVYCSPFRRAVQTAEVIAASHSLPLNMADDLRERDAGEQEGQRVRDMLQTCGLDVSSGGPRYPIRFDFPTAEPVAEVYSRMKHALGQILDACRDQSVVIVSHGMAIQMAIAYLTGTALTAYVSHPLQNLSVSKALVDPHNHAEFQYYGDLSFLPDVLSSYNYAIGRQ